MQDKVSTENAMAAVYVGIDVCKERLDIHLHPLGERFAVANDAAGRRTLRRRLDRHRIALVVMEPTAKYHRPVHRHLHAAGIATALVNPLRARLFAEAWGRLAKTDAVDARMLALIAERIAPDPTAPPDTAHEALQELAGAREGAIAEKVAVANRLATTGDAFLRRELSARVRNLERHIARLDRQLDARIAADPALAQRAAILRSIPGIGPVATLALLAGLDELGQLTAKQAAALAGLAPFARDSGRTSGERRIRAGRTSLRSALYMAALSASRCNPDLKRFYQNLKSRGKPAKLALIAVARKLVILANSLVANNRSWQPINP